MEKPKFRITLSLEKLYILSKQRYVDFESENVSIRLRLENDYSMELVECKQTKIPPNMVN
jgi:hypothetical protein